MSYRAITPTPHIVDATNSVIVYVHHPSEASPLLLLPNSTSSSSIIAETISPTSVISSGSIRWKGCRIVLLSLIICVVAIIICTTVTLPDLGLDSFQQYHYLGWNRNNIMQQQQKANYSELPAAKSPIYQNNNNNNSVTLFPITKSFVWGVATSSYQIEGGIYEDDREPTIWDTFVQLPDTVLDHSTGTVADDYYHLYEQDIQLMKSLHIQAYRFSIAWSRIVSYTTNDEATICNNSSRHNSTHHLHIRYGCINDKGIAFYDSTIDKLLESNITPYITLFHWDLPQYIQDTYNGWSDPRTIDVFVEYAQIIFDHFSSKVKHFITINEPWTFSVVGNGMGIHAPGHKDHPSTEPYLVAHNMLLAHAKVSKLYQMMYSSGTNDKDRGMIGISNCGDYRYAKDPNNVNDQMAAERAMLFQWGWFVHPIVFGDYPDVMRQRLGHRLPNFTKQEQEDLMNYTDFLGLNYYSSLLASTPETEASYDGYWADIHVNFTDDPIWDKNAMGWNVVPDGLREMLRWISERYNNPLIYITENGSAEYETEDTESVIHDYKRRSFLQYHIEACADAIIDYNVNLLGYFAWSLLDNFEWQFGYQRRFGLVHVNYTTQQRTPRDSALWYRDHIRHHELYASNSIEQSRSPRSYGDRSLRSNIDADRLVFQRVRPTQLPEKVLIGYGSSCEKVRQAVNDGVNVVIWAFIDIVKVSAELNDSVITTGRRNLINDVQKLQEIYTISTNLNLTEIRSLIYELYDTGYNHVLHFVSFGGWNGAHIDTSIPSVQWYDTFHSIVGDIFDGIDWDLEGNDNMTSSNNYFTIECLDHIGRISELAKEDGKFICMAPPQSYLNINSFHFSRFVNLTNPAHDTPPYSTFSYYGSNVYAYLVQRYGSSIDLISIQFYESYSEATYAIMHDGMKPSDYLVQYVSLLVERNETFYVNFTEDPEMKDTPLTTVSFPLNKLVFGFGNGWIDPDKNNKTVFINAHEINTTWYQLVSTQRQQQQLMLPRGFMFWSIDNEGENGVDFAKELHRILFPLFNTGVTRNANR